MSTSYASTKHQAEQGSESKDWIDGWVQKGLDATVTKIVNNATDQSVTYDQHGLLFRKKNPFTEEYDDIQLKIINSTLAVTTDNWETTKTALGKFIFYNPVTKKEEEGYGLIADKVVGNIILSEELGIYNKSGSMTFTDTDGLTIKNSKNSVKINPNSSKLFSISNTSADLLYVDDSGNLNVTGKIQAASGSSIGYWTISDNAIYHTSSSFGNANGKYFGTSGLSITDKFKVDSSGNLTCSGNITASGSLTLAGGKLTYADSVLSVSGKITASSGSKFGHWTISDSAIYNGSSSFGNANGKYFGTSGLSITDKFKVSSSGNLTCAGSITASGSLNLAGGKISYADKTLTVSGKITASSGSKFGHWTISDAAIYNGSSTFGASTGKYFGSSGLSITNKFKVDSSGNLTCSGNINASGTLSLAGGKLSYSSSEDTLTINAKITASSGSKIGYWTISDNAIYYGSSTYGNSSGKYFGTNGLSITDKFRVSSAGNITSSGTFSFADGKLSYNGTTLSLNGNITTTSGSIAGWKITSEGIYYDNGNACAGMGIVNKSYAFWAGSTYANRMSAPFRVGHDGKMYARGGDFGGSVTGISGTFTKLAAGDSTFQSDHIIIDADGNGQVRIGTPDYSWWVDLTLRPDSDNVGNIGTPDIRWSTVYSVVLGQSSVRDKKEEIQSYDIDYAYEELKNMPLYTFFYKGFSPESKNMSLGTMIDYIPSEVMMTTPNGNDCFNLTNLIFWNIAASQGIQRKLELLEEKIQILEETSKSA